MRSFFVAATLCGAVLAAPSCGTLKCNHDNCLRAFIRHGAEGENLCSAYVHGVQLPPIFDSGCDGDSARISSACACMSRPTVTVTVPASSALSQVSATATTASLSTSFLASSNSLRTRTRSRTKTKTPQTSLANVTATIPSSTSLTSVTNSEHTTSSKHHTRSKHTHSSDLTAPTTTTTSTQRTTTSEGSTTSKATTSSKAMTNFKATITSKVTTSSTSIKTTSTTSTASPTSIPSACVCTDYAQVAPAVAACTSIRLQNIHVPSGKSLDLSKVKAGTTVTFAGTTAFDHTSSSAFEPIILGGSGVTITADPGAILDGSGHLYWDGKGGNGGSPKPNHFIAVTKLTNSVISNLHIRNYPNRCFAITGCTDLTIRSIILDNSAGNAPNALSAGDPAAHNTDGFGVSTSTNVLITDCRVVNQDDCVAVTSGDRITVQNMQCVGSHGLSIGSIGGKANNRVTNVIFSDSTLTGAQNGARIKSNYGTMGLVSNITFENLLLDGVTNKGIIIQQDYLNGGATGNPSNGVMIENVVFRNVTGTVVDNGMDYYVLCGEGSCKNLSFEEVSISGGGAQSRCNFPAGGCPGA